MSQIRTVSHSVGLIRFYWHFCCRFAGHKRFRKFISGDRFVTVSLIVDNFLYSTTPRVDTLDIDTFIYIAPVSGKSH